MSYLCNQGWLNERPKSKTIARGGEADPEASKGTTEEKERKSVKQEKIDEYANLMRNRLCKFPLLYGRPGGQEGRHRALAAKAVGISFGDE